MIFNQLNNIILYISYTTKKDTSLFTRTYLTLVNIFFFSFLNQSSYRYVILWKIKFEYHLSIDVFSKTKFNLIYYKTCFTFFS